MNALASSKFVIIVFLAMQLFTRHPIPGNLRTYDKFLEVASVTVRALRPWMRAAQYLALGYAGEKVPVGRDGWLWLNLHH